MSSIISDKGMYTETMISEPMRWGMPLERLGQEDCEFEANLDYITRPSYIGHGHSHSGKQYNSFLPS
jgi:hypothetical protein